MGNLEVLVLEKKKDRAKYVHQLINDLEALEYMIRNGLIEKEPVRIGAEQEFCLVNNSFLPVNTSMGILEGLNDNHFTTEIGKFNLELNLDPLELGGDCFSRLHKDVVTFLDKAKEIAKKHQSRILLTGILPTLRLRHISEEYMTPKKRYFALNEAIKRSRQQDFRIHIKGVDELNLLNDSVMLEACNTSFQMHLQINPDEFIDKYNWAQAIAGPVLSACVNSPILFGKELWSETRIAVFNQSTDTRANSFVLNEKQARVSFGSHWETKGISDIFKDNISRFRSLLTSDFEVDSMRQLADNKIPHLKALNLHNGTVYRWNRVCYGAAGNKAHVRIECRYIPAGPSVADEIANMVFWVGLMQGQPEEFKDIANKEDFKNVRANFYKAGRTGLDSIFTWNDRQISAKDLILHELLPISRRGLKNSEISEANIDLYLGIIEKRLKSWNGAEWMVKSYRNLQHKKKPLEAVQVLTAYIYENQEKDLPVHNWQILQPELQTHFHIQRIVKHNMNTNIYTVDEKDSLELVINMMQWNNIHHMPVINSKKMLVGLLSWKDVEKFIKDTGSRHQCVKQVMKKDLITTTQDKPLEEAIELMKINEIGCLPVINKNKLIGILTRNDIHT
ncbi:CBS domain-containing protein [Christiangramia sabulilitoris]|uniref:CBS domain-containing protein n=1 Tax=Christiangramia sabulilitoris TaxID=2583991 RepID=A0A550I8U5_9FLAO|nr:CBS domain-containing protein [Christiangramia sabulilitoris]TRO67394.1 CBS domain-containing protein [Christiangramia sabulilitoris]